MLRRLIAWAACLVLAVWVLVLPSVAGAELNPKRLRALKRLQQQLILEEPQEKVEERRERRERAERRDSVAKAGGAEEREERGQKERREKGEGGRRERRDLAGRTADRARQYPKKDDRPRGQPALLGDLRIYRAQGGTTPPNILINDPTGENPSLDSAVQSEVAIAAFGNYLLVAWNDGAGHLTEESLLGYGYSTDGGVTWVDARIPPVENVGLWTSDPVLAVNEKTGVFYFAGLIDISETENGVGMASGSFVADTFIWNPPVVAARGPNESTNLDKCWIAADSVAGNVYITYTHFDGFIENAQFKTTSDRIRMVRSADGVNWSEPVTLSHPADDGFVQGSRPVVGPDGELYVTWQAIGQPSFLSGFNSPFGRDYMRIRKSTDLGVSFGAEVTVDSLFGNFANGGPGFNRGSGLTLPSIAVDRSQGPHRGRVYVAWNESINFYDAPLPTLPMLPPFPPGSVRTETENPTNNAPAFGLHQRFNVGQALSGRVGPPTNDEDFWWFEGIKGQTIVLLMDQLQSTLDPEFSIRCTEGIVRLAFNNFGVGNKGALVFTCPEDRRYFVRMTSMETNSTGSYRILTAWDSQASERARDHRDVFIKWSDDGMIWGSTVRVNDSEAGLDDWLPEVTVDWTGRVFIAHYDYRDVVEFCNGPSNVYMTRSDDGGSTWLPETRITDEATNWTTTGFNTVPNQGDYIGLFARDTSVVVGWSDGRLLSTTTTDTDPNVFTFPIPLDCSHAPVTAVDTVGTTRDFIRVNWTAIPGFSARVIRQAGGVDVDLGTVTAGADSHLVIQDATAQAATIYVYRLEADGYCESSTAPVVLMLPCLAQPVVTVDGTVVTQDSVAVRWSAPPGFTGTLSRRVGSGPYVVLFPVVPDVDGKIAYVDRDVTPGLSYGYRLDVEGFCKAFVGEVTAHIPPFPVTMRVQNPTIGDIFVQFTLPNSSPASIGLYDLSGRLLVVRQLDNGPGLHEINMTGGLPIRAGVYFLVLRQGATSVKQRVAMIR